jgi:hypothetical protein
VLVKRVISGSRGMASDTKSSSQDDRTGPNPGGVTGPNQHRATHLTQHLGQDDQTDERRRFRR